METTTTTTATNYQTQDIQKLINNLLTDKTPLLSKGVTNAKTIKNPLETYILYLSPFNQNSKGVNICPNAKLCIKDCLFIQGRGRFSNVQNARIARTEFYLYYKNEFCTKLLKELSKLYTKALNQKTKILIRLNGTSDLDFFAIVKNRLNFDILNSFGVDIQSPDFGLVFYDYTKILGKLEKYQNSIYTLTYSYQGINAEESQKALDMGNNVAVVFRSTLPKEFMGFSVIDGDISDIEMLSNKSKVLGLIAKGSAKKENGGFVVD
jgi:hypothetical protein